MNKKKEFFAEAIKNLKTVGTFTASSKTLIRNTIAPIDFSEDLVIVEFGAGDGPFTKMMLERMTPNSKLIAFELNEKFVNMMRSNLNDSRLHIIEASVEILPEVLQDFGIEKVDHIVSALPLVVFPEDLTYNILNSVKKYLKKTGYYLQISYSTVKLKMLKNFFDSVKIKWTLINVPPAFSYICQFK